MDTISTPVNLPPATDPVGLISALVADLKRLTGAELPASAQAADAFLKGTSRPESGHLEALDPAELEIARALVGNWRVWNGSDVVFTSRPEKLIAEIDRLTGELMGYRRSFQLRWAADKRATERWRKEAPDRELTWPDHADLVVWLLGQLREVEAERDTAVELAGKVVEAAGQPELEALRNLVGELDALIGASAGVLGLHKNGDLVPWDSLMANGQYPWLGALDEARDICDRAVLPAAASQAAETAAPSPLPPALVVQYRNYRGEVALRSIVPIGAPFHGATEHHPKASWILPVFDVERGVEREFTMDDMVPLAAMDGCRETVASITSWARDTFGEPKGVQRPLLRLVNEVVEACIAAGLTYDVVQERLAREWVRKLQKGVSADPEALGAELAGILVLLCRVADAASIPLRVAVDEEMERNRERTVFSRGDAGGARYLPSPDEVQAAQLSNGGWAPEQLSAWGVSNPPEAGWRKRLAEAWRIQQLLCGSHREAPEPVRQAVADLNNAIDYAINHPDGDGEAITWLRQWAHGDETAMAALGTSGGCTDGQQ